jgi:3-deoxy-manno-octulosonate cytidylyltransferase (CMP-KDO synthetase)
VKVVFDRQGEALYFSRSPIPHAREWSDDLLVREPAVFYQHVGLYAYRREFLLEYPRMERSATEKIEKLEQLRALDHGHRIVVSVIDAPLSGIDTRRDYERFVRKWRRQ